MLLQNPVNAQANDTLFYSGKFSVKVDSIIVLGNRKTDTKVIKRELTFGINDKVDPEILSYNRERIYSLGIFTRVTVLAEKINTENCVVIEVEESWYIYPIPFVELRDQDWEKISYGMDLGLRNLGGENETMQVRMGLGYDPVILFHYNYPYLFEKAATDLTFDIAYQKVKNKSVIAEYLYRGDFNQKDYSASIDLGKRFGLFNRMDFLLGYTYVETPFYITGINASRGRIDRTLSFGISYTHDTRDLAQFPSKGLYTKADLMLMGFGIDGTNYRIADIDFREYRILFSDLRAKWRFAGRFTFGGLVPYYNYSYLGYNERIRGYFNTEMEGNDSYLGSLEFNYPLLKDMNIDLGFVPVVPKELLSYRIALYLELFCDTGTTLMRGQSFSTKYLYTGYGTGLTFLILPYNILRIEYALNDIGKSEWIFGLGISF